jgi:ent-kaurene oxidase
VLPQRKAREAVTLSNGIHVPKGTHFAFPLGPVTRDPSLFPNPEQFDGLRYYRRRVEENLIGNSSKYLATTPSEEHLVFGHGHQACPGRFFAVNEVKLIMVFFLVNYEMKEPERQKNRRLHFSFEEYFVLNPTLKLAMRRRREDAEP